MSTEVGTRYSYSHIRAVLDTSTLGEIRSITDPRRTTYYENDVSCRRIDGRSDHPVLVYVDIRM